MFWGLTIEPGKHYSQTVDQSFHVSMAALDTREKSGITQLLVRHEKAEFLLCTLQYGDEIPFPIFQQQLNLNLAEGSEISFYSEGKGTIHLTGYLVMDEPMGLDESDLLLKAERSLMGEDEEDDEDEEGDFDDSEEDDEEEEIEEDSDMDSDASAEVGWAKMIQDVDEEEDEDSEEDEWTPQAAKKAKKDKKRKPTTDLSSPSLKKKRKAAVQAETLSKNEMEDEDEDEEDDDQDFMPPDDFSGDDDNDEEDDDDFDWEEDEEDEEEEEDADEESPVKTSPAAKKKEEKSDVTSPTKVKKELSTEADSAAKSASSESSAKKKKKKKKQQQPTEGSKGEQMPLKNLKANNKENIAAQKKEKIVKKDPDTTKLPAHRNKVKFTSGTVIEDIKVGEGKLAKPGKKVFMYYRGVFANSKKEFDSCLSGRPFMFILGRKEVINGWDEGIIGMKVGGKRKIIVPPSQGYGSERTGPIPPNSTLIFDVELKQVR